MSAESDRHLLLSVLAPAARLALRSGVPLADVKKAAELAYYREARTRGLKMREISDLMSVSMAKVGSLSKELKRHFAEPERARSIPRRVLSLLWVGPLTEKRIQNGLLDVSPEDVSDAIERLRREERIARLPGRTPKYELTSQAHRLVEDGWMARVDALGHMLKTASHVIEGRFEKSDPRAFSRTVGFRAIPEALEILRSLYEDQIFPAIVSTDEAARDREDAAQFALTFQFTPDFDEID